MHRMPCGARTVLRALSAASTPPPRAPQPGQNAHKGGGGGGSGGGRPYHRQMGYLDRIRAAKSPEQVMALLAKLEAKGSGHADKIHYNVAVERLAAGLGAPEEAALLPLTMHLAGVPAKIVRSTAMEALKRCADLKRADLAVQLLEALGGAKAPSSAPRGNHPKAAAAAKGAPGGLAGVGGLAAGGSVGVGGASVSPDVKHFTAGIRACSDDWERALAVVALMGAKGVRLDTIGYNALLAVSQRGVPCGGTHD